MLSDDVRQAIRESGVSGKRIAAETNIPQPTVCRFLNGADAKGATLDVLCHYLNLELRAPTKYSKAATQSKHSGETMPVPVSLVKELVKICKQGIRFTEELNQIEYSRKMAAAEFFKIEARLQRLLGK